MQVVMRSLLFLAAALAVLIFFAPKKELYHLLEHRLEKRGVILGGEALQETPFGLTIRHATLWVEGAELARIREAEVGLYLPVVRLTIRDLVPAEGMERVLPVALEEGVALYRLWRPREVALSLRGNFGKAEGSVDLADRVLRLRFEKRPQGLEGSLKRTKEGWLYEYRF
jgi:hypothetical protein